VEAVWQCQLVGFAETVAPRVQASPTLALSVFGSSRLKRSRNGSRHYLSPFTTAFLRAGSISSQIM
jgi:hypothetical protein